MKQSLINDATAISPRGSSAAASGEDDVIDLGALFATLWRGKWTILAATCAVLVVG